MAAVSYSLTGFPEASQTLIIFSISHAHTQPRTRFFFSRRLRGQCLGLGEEKSPEEETLFSDCSGFSGLRDSAEQRPMRMMDV